MDFKRLYQEAVKRDSDVRDAAYLELTTNICGIQIRQMTPKDFLILDGVDSPLLYGLKEHATEDHVVHFLWLLSTRYRPGRLRGWVFGRQCKAMINFGLACRGITAYVEDTFQDAPGGTKSDDTPFASCVAFWVHRISSAYGWDWRTVINTPLKVLFQQLKCIRMEENSKVEVRSRRILKLQGERLRLKNARLTLVSLLAKRGQN